MSRTVSTDLFFGGGVDIMTMRHWRYGTVRHRLNRRLKLQGMPATMAPSANNGLPLAAWSSNVSHLSDSWRPGLVKLPISLLALRFPGVRKEVHRGNPKCLYSVVRVRAEDVLEVSEPRHHLGGLNDDDVHDECRNDTVDANPAHQLISGRAMAQHGMVVQSAEEEHKERHEVVHVVEVVDGARQKKRRMSSGTQPWSRS
mmetsp:Transcript_34725/g.95740  ORF Transcript_34725/g.95740 Transcript_34725/m.95740 type:complete len:200 (+) Transcript_34725:20-619(+)